MLADALRTTQVAFASEQVSRNLAGQRLGRKGQETRERILAAALRLLEAPLGPPVTLTTIAREAEIRLTNLYLYFPDFEDLLLAVLRRVMETADAAYLDMLRERWPDDGLAECCKIFLGAHYRFWQRHARLLHLRNSVADTDTRMMRYRQQATQPLLDLLVLQMSKVPGNETASRLMATVVLTGFERVATVVTSPHFDLASPDSRQDRDAIIGDLIETQARLLELVIRDQRAVAVKPELGWPRTANQSGRGRDAHRDSDQ